MIFGDFWNNIVSVFKKSVVIDIYIYIRERMVRRR